MNRKRIREITRELLDMTDMPADCKDEIMERANRDDKGMAWSLICAGIGVATCTIGAIEATGVVASFCEELISAAMEASKSNRKDRSKSRAS